MLRSLSIEPSLYGMSIKPNVLLRERKHTPLSYVDL